MLAFLAQIGIGSIVDKLANAYVELENAKNDRERIVAEQKIKALEARRDVQIAEAGTPINALIRLLFALPVAIYFGKIYLWDKVLGWGVTDPLSPQLTEIAWVIISFYFISETAMGVTRVIRRR